MRHKKVLGLVMAGAASLLAACATAEKPAPQAAAAPAEPAVPITSPADLPASGVIVGGYAPIEQGDPNFEAARSLAIKQLYRTYPTSIPIASMKAEVQVVSGLNYRFNIVMEPDLGVTRAYTIIVYRDLQGVLTVTQLDRVAAPA